MPPTYDWSDGEHFWSVMTTIAARNDPSACPDCGKPGARLLTAPNIDRTAASDWNGQGFNPGLGCYTKGAKHARQIAKSRGLEEVGTEKLETIHKHFDQKREDIRAERWRDADRDKLYED